MAGGFSHSGKQIVSQKPKDAVSGVEDEDQLKLDDENLYYKGTPLTLQQ